VVMTPIAAGAIARSRLRCAGSVDAPRTTSAFAFCDVPISLRLSALPAFGAYPRRRRRLWRPACAGCCSWSKPLPCATERSCCGSIASRTVVRLPRQALKLRISATR
jgi:hypothetical protein